MNAPDLGLQIAPAPELPISEIAIDPDLQLRPVDEETAQTYADALRGNKDLKRPPVELPAITVVRYPDGRYVCADGQHRLRAHVILKRKTIRVVIEEGDRLHALLLAARSNTEHGKPRTADDKRRSILALRAQPEWADKSARWIAEQCRVSITFASETIKSVHDGQLPASKGKDGKIRKQPKKAKRKAFDVAREVKAVTTTLQKLAKRWPAAEPVASLVDLLRAQAAELEQRAQPEAKP